MVPPANLAIKLDHALQANPHYALCRDLQQLKPVEVVLIPNRAYDRFAAAEVAKARRLGDIKPLALSSCADWSKCFADRPSD